MTYTFRLNSKGCRLGEKRKTQLYAILKKQYRLRLKAKGWEKNMPCKQETKESWSGYINIKVDFRKRNINCNKKHTSQ